MTKGRREDRKPAVKRALLALLTAAALSLAPVPRAGAAEAVMATCGETIVTDTKLANDLIDCPNEGIVIGADNITLDLNGHTIDGDGTPTPDCPADEPCDVGIVNTAHDGPRPVNGPGHSGVTIKNGSVREFDVGFYGFGVLSNHLSRLTMSDHVFHGILFVRGSTDNRIEGNTLRDNGFSALALDRSPNNRVQANIVSNNGTEGILLVPGSDHNVIEGNSVFGSVFAGMIIEAHDNLVSRNRVFANGDGIIVFGSGNTIAENQVVEAIGCPDGCGFGISLEGGAGNLIARNTVFRTLADGIRVAAFDPDTPTLDTVVRENRVVNATGDGFSVGTEGDGTVGGTLIEGNISTGSGDDGFDVRSPETTLTSNLAVRNGDLGIQAVPGVVDGGGNKATGNGNPAQCIGVVCS